jgi:predicted transglutaminase-like cysteine proteinase
MRLSGGILAGLASLAIVAGGVLAGACAASAASPSARNQAAVHDALKRFTTASTPMRTARLGGTNLLPVATTATPVEDVTRPPIGWIDFCRTGTHPEDCSAPSAQGRIVVLTPALWASLTNVNRSVNASIEQVEDIALYGVQEKWTYPDGGKGDCEDLALLKRRILIAEGFPRQSLLMTVVRDETGAGHAILTVVTDRGDFILDSKSQRITPWRNTGYGFVKRQSQENPNVWVRLGEPASPGLIVAGH